MTEAIGDKNSTTNRTGPLVRNHTNFFFVILAFVRVVSEVCGKFLFFIF